MMDMKVDSNRIRSERENRAWSQQHLASASDLSLRTIQRIEKTGSASYESAQAIAACFEWSVSEIVEVVGQGSRRKFGFQRVGLAVSAITATVITAVALVSVQSVLAEQVYMDLGVTLDTGLEENEFSSQIVSEGGKDIGVKLDENYRLNVLATVRDDGEVAISFRVFEFVDGDFALIAEPRIVTIDGEEAQIEVGSDDDGETIVLRITVTPEIQ